MGWSSADTRRLFAADAIRLRRALGQPDVEALAHRCARQIRRELTGPTDSLATWCDTARALGAQVCPLSEDEPGPGYYDVEQEKIFVNVYTDEATLSRRVVHELAHHVLIRFKIRPRRRAEERYDDDRQTLEHRIARRVEELLLGPAKVC